MPHWAWWISMISGVPGSCWLMVSDRSMSSVTSPPALRSTRAWPRWQA
jgi:hypothetical protein